MAHKSYYRKLRKVFVSLIAGRPTTLPVIVTSKQKDNTSCIFPLHPSCQWNAQSRSGQKNTSQSRNPCRRSRPQCQSHRHWHSASVPEVRTKARRIVADFSGIVICLRDFPQLTGADTGEIDAVYRFFKAGGRVGWGCLAEIGASTGLLFWNCP